MIEVSTKKGVKMVSQDQLDFFTDILCYRAPGDKTFDVMESFEISSDQEKLNYYKAVKKRNPADYVMNILWSHNILLPS